MRLLATISICILILAAVRTIFPSYEDRGDKISFQEMRGDTVVIKGNSPLIAQNNETYSFEWYFYLEGEKVGEYIGDTPYMLAVIPHGEYRVIRKTIINDSGRETYSKSNYTTVKYLPEEM